MNRIAIVLLVFLALGLQPAWTAESGADPAANALSDYLHQHRLPLVEARIIRDAMGRRRLLMYGFVATQFGKSDAVAQARAYLDEPDIPVTNRIKVRPELLTLGRRPQSEEQQAETQGDSFKDYDPPADAPGDNPQAASDREAYMEQQDLDTLKADPGSALLVAPLAVAILGSASLPPAFAPPIVYDPIFAGLEPPLYRPGMPYIFPQPPIFILPHPIFPSVAGRLGPDPYYVGRPYMPMPFHPAFAPGTGPFGGLPRPGFSSGFGGGFHGGGFHGGGFRR